MLPTLSVGTRENAERGNERERGGKKVDPTLSVGSR